MQAGPRIALLATALLVATTFGAAAQPATGPSSLSGRVVTSAGGVLAGAVVTAYRDFEDRHPVALGLVEAGPDGSFELRGLPEGRIRLNLQAPCFATAQQELDVRAGNNGPISVALQRTGSVNGEVHDPDFQPVADALIALQPVPGSRVLRQPASNLPCAAARRDQVTDTNGRFAVTDVTPGAYYVVARRQSVIGARVFYPDSHTIETAVAVVVEEGQAVGGLEIGWSPPAVAITGRIVGRNGRVPSRLQLEYGQEGGTHRGTLTVSDANGRFTIYDPLLPRGPVTLIARGSTDAGPVSGIARVSADGARTGVTVFVGRSGGVTARVVQQAGSVFLDSIAVRFLPAGFSTGSEAGAEIIVVLGEEFTVEELTGEYLVQVAAEGWHITTLRRNGRLLANPRFEVAPEEDVQLEITVAPR